MASLANMKFWYVNVLEGYKVIFSRKCLSVQEANELYAEKKKEYADPKYVVMKENY